jgi:hypothetical protein
LSRTALTKQWSRIVWTKCRCLAGTEEWTRAKYLPPSQGGTKGGLSRTVPRIVAGPIDRLGPTAVNQTPVAPLEVGACSFSIPRSLDPSIPAFPRLPPAPATKHHLSHPTRIAHLEPVPNEVSAFDLKSDSRSIRIPGHRGVSPRPCSIRAGGLPP